jgi:hypothetical protein
LTDEEIRQIHAAADQALQAAARLRSVRLTNADEPMPIFRAHRKKES